MFDNETKSRFHARVDRRGPDECWPWTGGHNGVGYGVFYYSPGKSVLATRYACGMASDYIPPRSVYCLHSCDNPTCCNPKHLRWGTPTDNVADAISRKRHRKPPVHYGPAPHRNMPKGDAVWNQTLTEDKVRQIWALHLSGKNVSQIAEAVGAKKHAVHDVCRGRSWRHLPDAPSLDDLRKGGVRRGFNQFT